MSYFFKLIGPSQRETARDIILRAPAGWIVKIYDGRRTDKQNDKMWAMLSDVALSKPEGRSMTPEVWKCAFMQSLGHEYEMIQGIDGGPPFPMHQKSSRISKAEMRDLITYIQEYGDRHGVRWSEGPAKGYEEMIR